MIEYRVRPVTRFIVTRFEDQDGLGSSQMVGEFPNQAGAETVAGALSKADPGSVVCEKWVRCAKQSWNGEGSE